MGYWHAAWLNILRELNTSSIAPTYAWLMGVVSTAFLKKTLNYMNAIKLSEVASCSIGGFKKSRK